ncbi:MAG: type II toxin-antitoxin system VapC family toxin [Proteobacteria bacterium]|nr:type II toxin-antitoxin system VapC family toxin [Pseudomonadota bacterium]
MYLLDTNVVSELRKAHSGKADVNVARWAEGVDAAELFVSVITLQELEIGIRLAEHRDPRKGMLLRTWMEQHVLPAFVERVLPVDLAVALRAASLHVPEPRPERDALIAATALVHGMTVVTRNVVDFAPMGVEWIDPWQPNAKATRPR